MVSGVKIIKREELKGHQYIEGYARRLESKLVICVELQIEYMKGLMKVFSDGLGILREWEMIVLLKGYIQESVQVVMWFYWLNA